MTVDLEAIARRGRCDVSSLRIALPLLEQGYSPPFLARYRRDELSGLDESSLWALADAVRADETVKALKADLEANWQQTPLQDPAIGHAIRKSSSQRVLDRLARRIKQDQSESAAPSTVLAVRALSPEKADSDDLKAIADSIESIQDTDAALAGLDEAIARRLSGDPRVISAAVRWLAKHARIHVSKISDPHTSAANEKASSDSEKAETADDQVKPGITAAKSQPVAKTAVEPVAAETETPVTQTTASETGETPDAAKAAAETPDASSANSSPPVAASVTPDAANEPAPSEPTAAPTPTAEAAAPADDATAPAEQAAMPADQTPATPNAAATATPELQVSFTDAAASKSKAAEKAKPAAPKKAKKVSPRQRRRRWLVSVLKPLSGKRFVSDKLSSFQIVMLGRAMRSQVAECSFEYDAAKLVEEIKRVAVGLNRSLETRLGELVMVHEANIREAAEAAWWDELHERASVRLAGIAADHLRDQINRGGVEAKIVMSIDAVGPRTAATAIVSSDGQVLHCEDLPCQLSSGQRAAAVSKMGELIHQHHVDLIVISNGPSRRACMIALGELIKQSPESSLRWTLADRSGADTYAGSDIAGQEMRSTSRRFRAAAWLAFSVLQPAHALSKVDPLKLRLASFQRELSEDAMKESLDNVMTSAASRGGIDTNAASIASLQHLPGMNDAIAQAIDAKRRESLIKSRDELLELDAWQSIAESRQALPFLRVFGSEEALDGTLIHPDDYPLAKKLAGVLEIELPPATPPGYQLPEYMTDEQAASAQPGLKEAQLAPSAPVVEDLTKTGSDGDDSFGEGTDEQNAEAQDQSADETTPSSEGETTADTEMTTEATDTESTEAPATETPATETPATETEATPSDEPSSDASDDQASEPTDAVVATSDPAPIATELIKRPRPDKSKVDKCVKEWQVGSNRVHQLVSWLCDPFGDSDESGESPAVMTSMPTQKSLKPGDQVIGVVVGVMPFGVFVELAPDCSGLVHVSKATDSFVEDLHEAIQVGDVLTAWVTSIDNKKKRVALSAISPEREAQLREEKQKRSSAGGRGQGGPRGGQGGAQRGARGTSGGGQRSGGQSQGGTQSGGQSRGGGQAKGGQAGNRGGGSRPSGRGSGGGRSGRPDSRGGRGGRRDKKPETYNVVGKKVKTELTDDMKKGDEPLRSFGDLMQFFGKDETKPKVVKPPKKKPAPPAEKSAAPAEPDQTAAAKPDQPEPVAAETPKPATAEKPEPAAAEKLSAETTAPSEPTETPDS